jgi:hypothetical protein
MKHVGMLKHNPKRSALTGRRLDALTIIAKRRVLGAMEPESNLGGKSQAECTTLANACRPRYN